MNELLETGIEDVPDPLADISEQAEQNPWLELVEDGADVANEDLPAPVEIVQGIVAEHSKLVIGGGSKSFKTWLTIAIALCIAHGRPWLGRPSKRRRVFYINLELKSISFKRRLKIVANALGITIDREWFKHISLRGKMAGVPPSILVSRIIEIVKHFKTEVVVLDPIYKANTDGDENSSRDQTVFFNHLDRITTDGGCTLILNDHFGKGNQSEKDPLDAIRGSSAKGGDVDAAMVLRKHEVEGAFRVDLVHRELPPVAPFVVCWKYPLMELRADLSPEAMKKAKAGKKSAYDPVKLLTPIEDTTAENPISINKWAKITGVPRQTLGEYLPRLRVNGYIQTVGEGNEARQHITLKGEEFLHGKP